MKRLLVILSCLLCLNFVLGCEKEGPMEKAGEKMDETTKNVKEGVGEAVEETGEKMENAGEETEQAMDRSGEKMRE